MGQSGNKGGNMLYLDYAKPMDNGFILNFFADSADDIKEVSEGKEFIASNGMNYGVPLSGSTVVITSPDKTKETYILDDSGFWSKGKDNKIAKMAMGEMVDITAEDLRGVTDYSSDASLLKTYEKIGNVEFPSGAYISACYGAYMKSIVIPVDTIGVFERSFEGCKNLERVEWNMVDNVSEGDAYAEYFSECNNLKTIIYGEEVHMISSGACMNLVGLTNVVIKPHDVSDPYFIGAQAFAGCENLVQLTLPKNLRVIGETAFGIGSPTNKATITFLDDENVPGLEGDPFIAENLNKIIVPKGCGEMYRSAPIWSNYADFIEEAAE